MNPHIDEYGDQRWYNDQGQFHRTDGPAAMLANGEHHWFVNGTRHRTDGPAIISSNGSQHWYIYGEPHRLDGPAVIYANGDKQYWIHGNILTEAHFKEITQSEEHLNWYLLKIL